MIALGFAMVTYITPTDTTSFGILSAIPSTFLLRMIYRWE
jgi:hypothetical protein